MARKLKIIRNGGMYATKKVKRKKVIITLSSVLVAMALICSGIFVVNSNLFNISNILNFPVPTSDNDTTNSNTDTVTDLEDTETEVNTATDTPQSDNDGVPPLEYDSDEVGVFGDDQKKVYIFNNVAYEMFYGTDASALSYAKTVNDLSKKLEKLLGADTKFYDMIIPTRAEFTLPDKQKIKSSTFSQKNNMQTVADALNENITFINVNDILMKNRDEYIFFNTDPTWTALGAYYGYSEFMNVTGNTPISLEELQKNTLKVEGYVGPVAKTASEKEDIYNKLKKNADTVEYYKIPVEYEVKITDNNGNTQVADLYYPNPSSVYAYAVFLFGGDSPVMTIDTENNTGKRLLIIKDNSANAMIPYLACNYDEITVIDYRYIDGTLENIIKDKDINEVLFLNGIMDANTEIRNSSMREVLK